MDLLTISAFARLAHLSPKALRIYDELRLLPPVRVDPDTGYRWYSPDQLAQARQVARLRQLDMPLSRIRKVLDLPPDVAAVELAAYWAEREQALEAKRELVGFLIDQLTGRETAMYEVSIRNLPARSLLSISEPAHRRPDRRVRHPAVRPLRRPDDPAPGRPRGYAIPALPR